MEAREFFSNWNSNNIIPLIKVQMDNLSRVNLSSSTVHFLTTFGMPKRFFGLDLSELEKPISSLNKAWNLGDDNFEKYVVVGTTGEGDPIVIDTTGNDSIYFLNHDNQFEIIFINTNVACLMNTLKAFDEFYQILWANNPDSIFDADFSEKDYEELISKLKIIDARIFENNLSYWNQELAWLLLNREEKRNGS